MSVKPILFSTEMVRAILDGRKTVTRRVLKPQPMIESTIYPNIDVAGKVCTEIWGNGAVKYIKQPYHRGDILWVRETWGDYREETMDGESGYFYLYRADYPDGATSIPLPESERTDYADSWDLPKWHPSIHMPKEAARIWLRVTDVLVERLQEIGGNGLRAEGFDIPCLPNEVEDQFNKYGAIFDLEQAKKSFSALWDSTIKPADREKYGWAANPWVWVICFERCEKPDEFSH